MGAQDDEDEVLIGGVERVPIVLEAYDSAWVVRYEDHAQRVREAVGEGVLGLEHIGSTSVPGLCAKPIVDMLLVVADSANEAAYLPVLEGLGYQLRVREPKWHEHRMVRTPERDVHLHVFSEGCLEIQRQLMFRDRLRSNADDRAAYERVKRELAKRTWVDMNEYADAKSETIEGILLRAQREREGSP